MNKTTIGLLVAVGLLTILIVAEVVYLFRFSRPHPQGGPPHPSFPAPVISPSLQKTSDGKGFVVDSQHIARIGYTQAIASGSAAYFVGEITAVSQTAGSVSAQITTQDAQGKQLTHPFLVYSARSGVPFLLLRQRDQSFYPVSSNVQVLNLTSAQAVTTNLTSLEGKDAIFLLILHVPSLTHPTARQKQLTTMLQTSVSCNLAFYHALQARVGNSPGCTPYVYQTSIYAP